MTCPLPFVHVADATSFDLGVLLIGDAQCRHNELYFVFQAVAVALGSLANR